MRLNAPPVNALDREVLLEITATLRAIEATDARAVVLTGSGSAFSAGADLFRVLNEGDEYLRTSLAALTEAFGTLFQFPLPVVAAVNGHAIAGGAVLVCASDHRISAAGNHKIGFAELRVGVPFPAWALESARVLPGGEGRVRRSRQLPPAEDGSGREGRPSNRLPPAGS